MSTTAPTGAAESRSLVPASAASASPKTGALMMEWEERDGQVSARPLISRSLGSGAGGGAKLDFRPTGVVCQIAIPRYGHFHSGG